MEAGWAVAIVGVLALAGCSGGDPAAQAPATTAAGEPVAQAPATTAGDDLVAAATTSVAVGPPSAVAAPSTSTPAAPGPDTAAGSTLPPATAGSVSTASTSTVVVTAISPEGCSMAPQGPFVDAIPIRRGDGGDRVAQLQVMLAQLGYDVGASGPDGHFGPDSQAAFEAWQSTSGQPPTGVVCMEDWYALVDATGLTG